MASRVQKRAEHSTPKKTETTEAPPIASEHKSPEEIKAELDAMLDEIEEVLVENAAEFVASYQQKGGQ